MERKYIYRLILGIAIMAAGILSDAFLDIDVLIPIVLVNVGLIILVATAFRLFRRGDLPDRDERTKKLAAYGITYSWLLTLIAIMVLFWIQYFGLAELTADGVLGMLLFFMIISANVFRWYFIRKGDIE
jgi:predicted histidine transporter YuiF (NhaC family)